LRVLKTMRQQRPVRSQQILAGEYIISDPNGEVVFRAKADDIQFYLATRNEVIHGVALNTGDVLQFSPAPEQASEPPGWSRFLLRCLLPQRNRTAVIGDLLEEYAVVQR